jgi:hypothetical protein
MTGQGLVDSRLEPSEPGQIDLTPSRPATRSDASDPEVSQPPQPMNSLSWPDQSRTVGGSPANEAREENRPGAAPLPPSTLAKIVPSDRTTIGLAFPEKSSTWPLVASRLR